MKDVDININAKKFKIVLIGAGGTGGNLAPMIARLIGKTPDIEFTIVDGDIVESSNLERQPYLEVDIATNKAQSLSEKINIAFDMNTRFFPQYIESAEQLKSVCGNVNRWSTITILIGAVDNHRARVIMEQYFSDARNLIYIDSANEDYYGDVICALKVNGEAILKTRGMYRPTEVFSGKGRVKNTSCAVKVVDNPQYYPTNQMAANIVLKMVSDIIVENNIHSHFVNFDTNEYVMFDEADPCDEATMGIYTELLENSKKECLENVS